MNTIDYISVNTGQNIKLVVQTLDGYGQRYDGYIPIMESLTLPNMTLSEVYPISMLRINTGLYYQNIQIPDGYLALGTYIANIFWLEESNSKYATFVINANRPFGNAMVTPL